MESRYFNIFVFEIRLYHYEDIVNLHYNHLNILSLICYNSDYDCFCNKFHGWTKKLKFRKRFTCVLSHKIFFRQGLLNFEKNLDRNQFNLLKLKSYIFKFYPFLLECYWVD